MFAHPFDVFVQIMRARIFLLRQSLSIEQGSITIRKACDGLQRVWSSVEDGSLQVHCGSPCTLGWQSSLLRQQQHLARSPFLKGHCVDLHAAGYLSYAARLILQRGLRNVEVEAT